VQLRGEVTSAMRGDGVVSTGCIACLHFENHRRRYRKAYRLWFVPMRGLRLIGLAHHSPCSPRVASGVLARIHVEQERPRGAGHSIGSHKTKKSLLHATGHGMLSPAPRRPLEDGLGVTRDALTCYVLLWRNNHQEGGVRIANSRDIGRLH
jgi:hypothetical protein